MPEKIYFHIGSMKTASTFIQKFMYENRDRFLENGVDYILFQEPRLDLPRWANADFLFEEGFDADFVAEKLAASPAEKVVISDEGLMSRPHIWQNDVFKKYRRAIVLYLRNPVDLIGNYPLDIR